MKEKYQIEIEGGEYENKKQFKKLVELDERQFMGLITTVLDYSDKLPLHE
jgi:hypothetical protein